MEKVQFLIAAFLKKQIRQHGNFHVFNKWY